MKILREHWPIVVSYLKEHDDVNTIYLIKEIRSFICGDVWIDIPNNSLYDLSFSIGRPLNYPGKPVLGSSLHHSLTFHEHNEVPLRDPISERYFDEYASAVEHIEEANEELLTPNQPNTEDGRPINVLPNYFDDMNFISSNPLASYPSIDRIVREANELRGVFPRVRREAQYGVTSQERFRIPRELVKFTSGYPIIVFHVPHYMTNPTKEINGMIKFMLKHRPRTFFRISIQGELSEFQKMFHYLTAAVGISFGHFIGFDFPDVTVLNSSTNLYPQNIGMFLVNNRTNYYCEKLEEMNLELRGLSRSKVDSISIYAPKLEKMKLIIHPSVCDNFGAFFQSFHSPKLKEVEIISDSYNDYSYETEKVTLDLYGLLECFPLLKTLKIKTSLIKLEMTRCVPLSNNLKILHLENITTSIPLDIDIMKGLEKLHLRNLAQVENSTNFFNWCDNLQRLTIIDCECFKSIERIYLPNLQSFHFEYKRGGIGFDSIFMNELIFPKLVDMSFSIICHSTKIQRLHAPVLRKLIYNVKSHQEYDHEDDKVIFDKDNINCPKLRHLWFHIFTQTQCVQLWKNLELMHYISDLNIVNEASVKDISAIDLINSDLGSKSVQNATFHLGDKLKQSMRRRHSWKL